MRNSILSFLLVVIEIAFGQHFFYCSIFSGKLQPVFLNGCAGQFSHAEKPHLILDMSDINRVRYHFRTYPPVQGELFSNISHNRKEKTPRESLTECFVWLKEKPPSRLAANKTKL
jgi:hypothetical protein